jgi:hypothetical protein
VGHVTTLGLGLEVPYSTLVSPSNTSKPAKTGNGQVLRTRTSLHR